MRSLLLIAAAVVAGGAVLGVAPFLIRQGYAGESFPFINDAFGGRAVHDVDFYLRAWWSLVLRGSVVVAALGAITFLARSRPELLRSWVRRPLMGAGEALPSVRSMYSLAITLGLAGGLAQVTYRAVRQVVTDRPAAGFFWELLWMTPLASAAATVCLAGGLHLLSRYARSRVGTKPATAVFAFPAILGLMRSEGIPLHGYAEVLIALGLTALLLRVAFARPGRMAALLRRGPSASAALAVILVGFAVFRWPSVAEWRALRGIPEAGSTPNVLLIILDTVRSDHLGLYGYARNTTPHLDAWADDAAVFERAYATAPWTLPSHASMFTGHYPHATPTGWTVPLTDTVPTLAEALTARGYATAGFVANLAYTTPMSGLSRGFSRYEAHPISVAKASRSAWLSDVLSRPLRRWIPGLSADKIGEDVTEGFLRWLDEPRDRPFFAFLNYFDAHDPYEPPEPWRTAFGPGPTEPWVEFDRAWSAGERATLDSAWVDRYDGGIAYVDEQLGIVFRSLEERGLAENTVVIVTSDHGEHWGEHGLVRHTTSVYRPVVQVPLVVKVPGSPLSGVRLQEDVSLRDLPASVMALLGEPDGGGFPGHPLRWGAPPETPQTSGSPALAELGPPVNSLQRALVDGDWYYVWRADGADELYALPDDEVDVSGRVDLAPVLARFRSRLADSNLPR